MEFQQTPTNRYITIGYLTIQSAGVCLDPMDSRACGSIIGGQGVEQGQQIPFQGLAIEVSAAWQGKPFLHRRLPRYRPEGGSRHCARRAHHAVKTITDYKSATVLSWRTDQSREATPSLSPLSLMQTSPGAANPLIFAIQERCD